MTLLICLVAMCLPRSPAEIILYLLIAPSNRLDTLFPVHNIACQESNVRAAGGLAPCERGLLRDTFHSAGLIGVSHTFTVQSPLPETICLPFLVTDTPATPPVWPL